MATEIYNHEEFFERARAGEFVGDKVTLIQKYVIDEVTESREDEDAEWFVNGDAADGSEYCFWEDCNYGPKRIFEVERRG